MTRPLHSWNLAWEFSECYCCDADDDFCNADDDYCNTDEYDCNADDGDENDNLMEFQDVGN